MIRKFLGASFMTIVAVGAAQAVRKEVKGDQPADKSTLAIGAAVAVVGTAVAAVMVNAMFQKD